MYTEKRSAELQDCTSGDSVSNLSSIVLTLKNSELTTLCTRFHGPAHAPETLHESPRTPQLSRSSQRRRRPTLNGRQMSKVSPRPAASKMLLMSPNTSVPMKSFFDCLLFLVGSSAVHSPPDSKAAADWAHERFIAHMDGDHLTMLMCITPSSRTVNPNWCMTAA